MVSKGYFLKYFAKLKEFAKKRVFEHITGDLFANGKLRGNA